MPTGASIGTRDTDGGMVGVTTGETGRDTGDRAGEAVVFSKKRVGEEGRGERVGEDDRGDCDLETCNSRRGSQLVIP